MKLTVIGSAGSYPGPESPASCYLLEADLDGRTWRILLDLGNGALGVLQRYADPLAIDAVFVSHLHPDHCVDLCGYYVLRKYHPAGQQSQIPVWGPVGTADRMARAYDLEPGPGMNEVFDFQTYGDGPIRLGPFTVEPIPMVHPVPAYGFRISAGGGVLAYSGDTAACEGLERAAAGAELLLAEASFLESADNPEGIHLTGHECGETATRGGVGRLVLTHIPAWHDPQVSYDEARAAYSGPVDLARTGATYDL